MRDCIIVVGMHRSGTSALAGALQILGVDFGPHLVAAQPDNARGYYEHRQLLKLHEELLAAGGSSWDDPADRDWEAKGELEHVAGFQSDLRSILEGDFAGSDLWGVKDPRLSRLLPLWLPVLAAVEARPHVVIASRSPSEIAGSLARRNGFSREKSSLLWVLHTLAAERASRPFPRAFVDYAGLLRDPNETMARLGRQLGLPWDVSAHEDGLRAFLDPSLRHQHAAEGDEGAGAADTSWGRVSGLVGALARAVSGAAKSPGDTEPFDELAERRVLAGAAMDPLVLEHLHQFGRREVERELWSQGRALQDQLAAAAERLGAGVAAIERQLAAVTQRVSLLDRGLEARDREVGRTLDHLGEALAAAEQGLRHLGNREADLGAKVSRWEDEVGLEGKLAALEEKLIAAEAALSYLSSRLDVQAAQLEESRIAAKRSWWQRFRDRRRSR